MIEDVSYFRKTDNNPFAIDGTPIDRTTLTRLSSMLPGGNFVTNGNRAVAEQLGLTDTQSVMYSRASGETVYSGLVSDDINMVELANTGVNREIGGTPVDDDYQIELIYQDDCTSPGQAEIEIALDSSLMNSGFLGVCDADIVLSFPDQPTIFDFHWSLFPEGADPSLKIRLNQGRIDQQPFWLHGNHIFSGGFESGDYREGWERSP